jgi:solute carrier family 8 (sodium/calcium exchanger)
MALKAHDAQLVLALLLCAATGALADWDESCKDVSGKLLGFDSDEEDAKAGKIEDGWPMPIRLICYLIGLFYCFYAVGLISDIFMEGIDKVTAKKLRRTDKLTGQVSTTYAWNATIANLSLMALGSSAPEIMLGCIEVAGGSFLLGPLGPGVIVGSAAFNLLVISAVCVNAHEDGKVTKIKETPVYIITAFFSVWAYIWLFIIISAWTPDVVTWPEAVITIIQFPILLFLAYLADRGKITFGIQTEEKGEDLCIIEGATKEELAVIEHQIKEKYGQHLSEEQVIGFMKAQYCTRRNKAFYAHVGLRKAFQGEKVDTKYYHDLEPEAKKEPGVSKDVETSDDKDGEMAARTIKIGFECLQYACLESARVGKFKVVRTGPPEALANCGKVTVKYKTIEGTASKGTDFQEVLDGEVSFEQDEMEKEIRIEIMNDNAYEEDEDFYLELHDPKCAESKFNAALEHGHEKAQMTIIDDDLPGKIRFKEQDKEVEEEEDDTEIEIIVERFDGSSGTIECKYKTENIGAVAGIDYEEAVGTVKMHEGEMSAPIKITIKASGRYTNKAGFLVHLTDPTCPNGTDAAKAKVGFDKNTDGGEESCICKVEIKGKKSETRDRLLSRMASKLHGSRVAHQKWKQQFIDAVTKVVEEDDEGEEEDPEAGGEEPKGPKVMDYVFHGAALPWKLLFACVPPTDYAGGWPTFYVALFFIGLVTVLVGDLAELLGCSLTIPAEITAITFVALGTSLPDTFASKTAAEMDPYADNSIGNVTGSNSVNVMLGCGLAWTLGAFYWFSTAFEIDKVTMEKVYNGSIGAEEVRARRATADAPTPKELWLEQFQKYDSKVQDNIMDAMGCSDFECSESYAFMVPAGTLYFNLALFSILALLAIAHLAVRRRIWGGELGGPKKGFLGQYMSGAILACKWLVYIAVSSMVCVEVIKL